MRLGGTQEQEHWRQSHCWGSGVAVPFRTGNWTGYCYFKNTHYDWINNFVCENLAQHGNDGDDDEDAPSSPKPKKRTRIVCV